VSARPHAAALRSTFFLVTLTPTPTPDLWTTRRLLAWMMEAFEKKGMDSPRVQAEMLLEHTFSCKRLALYTDPDRPVTPIERQQLRDLVARALKHEPVQYLVGEAKFFGLDIKVDRRVLIPRPSTATIVEEVLQHQRALGKAKGEGLLITDICTGSGCIAIALLKNLPLARAVATDISPQALELARENAQRHAVLDRLDLLEGNLMEPLLAHPATMGSTSIDYIVSNPPYIPDHEWPAVEPNVKEYEPHLALRGGTDGLTFIRPLFAHAPRLLKPGGLMLVEVATSHAALCVDLARETLHDVRIRKDIDGLERVVIGSPRT
jgi:release factor glutamine methyltransferase